MTQREKALSGSILAVLGIYAGYMASVKLVYRPAIQTRQDIAREIKYRDKLQLRLNGSTKALAAWHNQTSRTLAADSFDAHQMFREDVGLLLKRNNLNEELKISKYKARVEKKGPRQGFEELPLSVRVKGRLDDLDNFLKEFYQRPYFVRLDKLQIDAERLSHSKKKRGAGPTEPKLGVTMMLSTLVLPKADEVDHPVFDMTRLTDPDPEAEITLVSAQRLRQEDVEAYNQIAKVNIFKKYEPPPPKPKQKPRPKPPAPKVAETKPEPPRRPPPPDPRRDAHKFVVNGVGRLDDGPIAYVVNTDSPDEPATVYRLNAEMDDGKLVLIVPEGLVIRVTPKSGRDKTPKNYLYKLGASFKERQEVDSKEHPAIAKYLEIVLNES